MLEVLQASSSRCAPERARGDNYMLWRGFPQPKLSLTEGERVVVLSVCDADHYLRATKSTFEVDETVPELAGLHSMWLRPSPREVISGRSAFCNSTRSCTAWCQMTRPTDYCGTAGTQNRALPCDGRSANAGQRRRPKDVRSGRGNSSSAALRRPIWSWNSALFDQRLLLCDTRCAVNRARRPRPPLSKHLPLFSRPGAAPACVTFLGHRSPATCSYRVA